MIIDNSHLYPCISCRLHRKILLGLRLTIFAMTLGFFQSTTYAAIGDTFWKFYADFGVTVVEPIGDLSGNGGLDALVGSADDSLYLVEAKGSHAGNQLWAAPFKSTLSSAIALPDINNDGKIDVAGGDQFGLIEAVSGATGQAIWKFLTFGTVLSLASIPDADGDGIADIVAGSENDTVYCLSGKPGGSLGKSIWTFGNPLLKSHPVGSPNGKAAPKLSVSGSPKSTPTGANSVALLSQKIGNAFGLVVGTSWDTVYCLALKNGAVKWKTGLPGDIWKVLAFPDQDGDGVEEVLAACGADEALLLNGVTGSIIWSHAVSLGATSIAATEDMNGDGNPDALIGDGNGTVHCVPGSSKGLGVNAAWTYDFGDTSTILSISAVGDLDKDGKGDCAVGTSNDMVAVLSGKGSKTWSANLGGQVTEVTSLGDLDGDGMQDFCAGSDQGFAQTFSGGGAGAGVFRTAHKSNINERNLPRLAIGRIKNHAYGVLLSPPRQGSGMIYDTRGRGIEFKPERKNK